MLRSRILCTECKGGGLVGDARIGRVTFSKVGKSIYYKESLLRHGREGVSKQITTMKKPEWNIGFLVRRKTVKIRLCGERLPIEIDEDVREEYWAVIRNEPEGKKKTGI